MGENSQELHEENLPADVIDRHRAIASIMEELEAVDWYDQRVAATNDASLAEVLGHSRDEEKEHAAMTLEWLRRNDPGFDGQLREWLFTDKPLGVDDDERGDGADDGEVAAPSGAAGSRGSLGVGTLYGKEDDE